MKKLLYLPANLSTFYPHKPFFACNYGAVRANGNTRVFAHPPLTISRLYVCNAAPCCAISFNKDNDDCSQTEN